MKNKKTMGMLLLGSLLVFASCKEPEAGIDAPSGLTPTSGSITTNTNPEFGWTAVDGAAKYEIQIADSEADLESNPTVDDKNVTDTSYTPTAALINQETHYWRVRAVDSGGQAGAWSEVFSLQVEWGAVSGLTPADGSTITSTKPTFSWTAVDGAAKYEIQIADSEANLESSRTVDAEVIGTTSYTPTTALTNQHTHHWRIRAVDSGGEAGAWLMSTLLVEWGAVSGLEPVNGSSTPNTKPTFSWTAVDGADKYEIQIADSEANLGSGTVAEVTNGGTSYTPTTALTNQQTHHWRVRAVDIDGQAGAWSGASSLQVEWGGISNLAPADGSTITSTKPTFSWDAVAGADKYEIQIADSEANLGSGTVAEVTNGGTSYTPTTALTNQQTHHWRVRAVDIDGQAGAWSGASSLQVEWGGISNLAPADGSTITSTKPTFSWDAVAGADKYEIQIADSEANLGSGTVAEVTNGGTSYTPTTALTNQQTHHWRVRAVDGDGQAGAWSGASSLQVEWGGISNLAPADGSTITSTKPTFSWDAVAGADKYEIQIADSEANLGSGTVAEVTNGGTSYTPTTALTNLEENFWRIRAVDSGGEAGAWLMSTLLVEWGAVSGLEPVNGSSTPNTKPTFSWTAVDGADKYEIQIADSEADLDSNPTVDDKNVNGTSYTPTLDLTIEQKHYWRVRAVDIDGQAGAWSGASSLQVEWGGISNLAPADGSTITSTKPTFSWDAVAGADKYEIQIADSEANLGSGTVAEVTNGGTSYTPTTALTNQQTHHWRVRAVDGDGQAGAWSGSSSLRVEWGGTVSGLTPADGSSTTDTTPEFSWSAVTGSDKYEIQIAESEEALAGSTPAEVTGGDTSYTPTAALTNQHTHHWRVRAVDIDGQAGAWSGSSSLRVEIGAVSGLEPVNGSSTTDTTPEFSWSAVTGADKYEIQIADSAANLAGSSAVNVSGTSYTPTTALADLQWHHWRVRAMDGDGQFGNWSNIHSFGIGSFVGGPGPAGGIVFYDKGSYSNGWRYLEAAPSDQGSYEWGAYGAITGGTQTGIGSGKTNTDNIVAMLGTNEGTAYASKICAELDLGGKDDWFLPSKDELNALYEQRVAVGDFSSGYYYWSSSDWSSSENVYDYAWAQNFGNGSQFAFYRDNGYRVRAVRAF